MLHLSVAKKRPITVCNTNYSPEGIFHPDRIMQEYDFLYMVNGSWEIIENDVCYPVREGQLLILEPGLHHYSKEKCSPHMRNMFLHCPPLPGDGTSGDNSIPLNKLTDCTSAPQIARLFRAIIETYWNRKDDYTGYRLSNLFELLLLELSTCGRETLPADPLIKEILHLFFNNCERFYTLEELAKLFGIGSRSLGIRFKQATGTTLHQYQLALKLNMIHELLPANPTRGLRDIALSFGFYDEFQFSKLYKRQFGCPPSSRRSQ